MLSGKTMAPQEGLRLRVHEDFEEPVPPTNGKKCVGINGRWYDVTHFMDKHPGGPILSHFIGKDATVLFNAFGHDINLLKYRKPIGTYDMSPRHPADKEFDDLAIKYEKLGYFKTDWTFYLQVFTVIYSLFALSVYTIISYNHLWYMRLFGGISLAFFWQQSGFVLHEVMHSQLVRSKRDWDRALGVMIGTINFGLSSHWWQDEHYLHHGMTNMVDVTNRWVDPQMWEAVWAQNTKLFPLYKTYLQYLLIKIQHITFIPVVMIAGRINILIECALDERRWYEWLGMALHWVWICALFSYVPSWSSILQIYGVACMVEGVFHFQLILSHYCKAFIEVEDFHKTSWYVYQISANMNIDNYWWMDWYYGGLNFHIEHHLFPKMARQNLRKVSADVKAICSKYGIQYDSDSFPNCLVKTLGHLKESSTHFKLDPR